MDRRLAAIALALVATFGVSTSNLVIAVAVSTVPIFVRLARSSALTIRELPYVEAALREPYVELQSAAFEAL